MKKVSIVLLLVLSLALAGCAQQGKPTSGETTSQKVTLIGSGATFPQPQLEKWIDAYMKLNTNVVIEYTGKGSGGGQTDFEKGLVDFACSDPPIKEALWKKLEQKGQPLQFPMIVGAVVVSYNVPGIKELRLDGKTLAGIFMGKIRYWDDPAIKNLNPNLDLPHKEIIVVHRSDSSGTTKIFTTYLCLVSDEWKEMVGSGKVVEWPVDKLGRGVGGKGNPGVVAAIKNNPYSIGYTELAYAIKENLPIVALENRDGYFVKPNDTTIKAAIAEVSMKFPSPKEGYKEKIENLLNAPGKDSYPIVAVSHIIVWEHYQDKAKERAIRNFVKWILTDGQNSEYIAAGYVGLPSELTQKLLEEVGW